VDYSERGRGGGRGKGGFEYGPMLSIEGERQGRGEREGDG
jgi:hypothetical protein